MFATYHSYGRCAVMMRAVTMAMTTAMSWNIDYILSTIGRLAMILLASAGDVWYAMRVMT